MWVDFVVHKILGFRGERLKDYFDDLALEKVVPQVLQTIFDYQGCENAIWLLKDEFLRLTQKKETPSALPEPEQLLNRHLHMQAIKSVSEFEIEVLLSRLSSDDKTNSLIPILHFQTHEPMAYVLLTGIKALNKKRFVERISRDLTYMAKHIAFSIQHWETQKLSFLDDLTGLYNQKFMSQVLESEIHRSQRDENKFSVLFMDVDYFKAVNDTRGHWIGSRLLIEIGRVLKSNIRRSDYAFRYGGDEFVIVLPQSNAEQAMIAAERLRTQIERTDFIIDGEHLKLTLSIGLATYPDHAKTHKEIIKMADEAMYCGKNKSRNIVFVAS